MRTTVLSCDVVARIMVIVVGCCMPRNKHDASPINACMMIDNVLRSNAALAWESNIQGVRRHLVCREV
jgi:hypothetical protein